MANDEALTAGGCFERVLAVALGEARRTSTIKNELTETVSVLEECRRDLEAAHDAIRKVNSDNAKLEQERDEARAELSRNAGVVQSLDEARAEVLALNETVGQLRASANEKLRDTLHDIKRRLEGAYAGESLESIFNGLDRLVTDLINLPNVEKTS